jgi:hypothetical protein
LRASFVLDRREESLNRGVRKLRKQQGSRTLQMLQTQRTGPVF